MNRILVTLCLLACAAFAADEKPAAPQNFKHRLTGLFSPDRETALHAALKCRLPQQHAVPYIIYDIANETQAAVARTAP